MAVYRFFTVGGNSVNFLLCRNFKVLHQEQTASLSGKVLEKLGLPSKPKKPLTPYLKFCNSRRQKVMSDHPNLPPIAVVKTLAQQWLSYDKDQKDILQREYENEKKNYEELIINYNNSLTSEQMELIEHAKQREKTLKSLTKKHEKSMSLGKPKRPMTAFFQFLSEHKSEKDPDVKYTEYVKEMGKSWECLSSSEKEKYYRIAKTAMENYYNELENWEKDMISSGHLDVVRKTSILMKTEEK